jgi:hypothetical protein
MNLLWKNAETPSHYVAAKIKQHLSHLISRGAKIERITGTHVVIQDMDEWLWQDSETLDRVCRYQLVKHVYSSVSTSADDLNGLVVSISIVQPSIFWGIFQKLTSLSVCVAFFLWIKYVMASGILQPG